MITVDKLDNIKGTIENLVQRGNELFADIAETAKDRARLLHEAQERERVIERLNSEADHAAEQINDLTMRNTQLASDVVRLESLLTDATARLDSILATANRAPQPSHRNGNGARISPTLDTKQRESTVERLARLTELRPRQQGLLPRSNEQGVNEPPPPPADVDHRLS